MTQGLTTGDAASAFLLPRRRVIMAFGSVVLSAAVLALSVFVVDARQVGARLSEAEPRWLLGFFLVYLLQISLLGLRWSLIARALGVPLGWGRASAEYALSVLINLLLPSGFAGDGWRALRHSTRAPGHRFPKILEALALDRLSGQVTLLMVVLVSAPFAMQAGLASPLQLGVAVTTVLAIVGAAARWARTTSRARGLSAALRSFLQRAVSILFEPRRAAPHLCISLLLVGTHLIQLWLAARAAGIVLDARLLLWLGPLISLAASAPSFFGSWGIREGACALLFASAGLPSSAGVAVSVLVGTFSLVSALPGFAVMLIDGQATWRELCRASQGLAGLRGSLSPSGGSSVRRRESANTNETSGVDSAST